MKSNLAKTTKNSAEIRSTKNLFMLRKNEIYSTFL